MFEDEDFSGRDEFVARHGARVWSPRGRCPIEFLVCIARFARALKLLGHRIVIFDGAFEDSAHAWIGLPVSVSLGHVAKATRAAHGFGEFHVVEFDGCHG